MTNGGWGAGKRGLQYGKQVKRTTQMVREGDFRMTAAVNMRVCMCVSSQPGLYTFTITWTQDGELTNGQKILATERQNG